MRRRAEKEEREERGLVEYAGREVEKGGRDKEGKGGGGGDGRGRRGSKKGGVRAVRRLLSSIKSLPFLPQ